MFRAEKPLVDGKNANYLSPAQIAETRATSAERLKRQLSGDIDTIVLKALRKEPQRRYPSAEQFAEDIRRYLEGLPVTAQRNSGSYRAGKFVRRHKTGVAAAALVVASLIAGVLATSWQASVARSERAKAERRFNDVRKLTTTFLFDFDAVHSESARFDTRPAASGPARTGISQPSGGRVLWRSRFAARIGRSVFESRRCPGKPVRSQSRR